nr:MAG TPA: POPLD domain protein [Caudoviricetes sp.]
MFIIMFRSLHIANKIPHFPHSYPPCKLPAQYL